MNGQHKRGLKQYYVTFLLIASAIIIKVLSLLPQWIEYTYLPYVYRPIARVYRALLGWLPFSVGDILYAFAGCWIALQCYRGIKALAQRNVDRARLLSKALRLLQLMLCIYIYFNLAWGLNYNRLGIAHQLQLQPKAYNEADLKMITAALLPRVNSSRRPFADTVIGIPPYQQVYASAVECYQQVSRQFPFLQYSTPSIKKSYYGRLGNYLGFLGYYNPFTGEAQVNLTIPRFTIPIVSCHELAHQLGYASESEASFAGYLAAVHSGKPLFIYSAYFDMFMYANRELGRKNSAAARANLNILDTLVRGDYRQVREFQQRTRNPIEDVIHMFYDYYLKANQQEKGVESYNQVVGWLIAYKKKHGTI